MRYKLTRDPLSESTDPRSAVNGPPMRLTPVPMFFFPDCERAAEMTGQDFLTTHDAAGCLDACRQRQQRWPPDVLCL